MAATKHIRKGLVEVALKMEAGPAGPAVQKGLMEDLGLVETSAGAWRPAPCGALTKAMHSMRLALISLDEAGAGGVKVDEVVDVLDSLERAHHRLGEVLKPATDRLHAGGRRCPPGTGKPKFGRTGEVHRARRQGHGRLARQR